MDHHPLLSELLEVCTTHNVELAKAYTTFEVYQELSEVRKLSELKYFFSTELKLFYLSGKRETDEISHIYLPVMFNDEITPQEINSIQEILTPDQKQFYLYIRDADSSSTCYSIMNGLMKPDSPDSTKEKKELEGKKFQFDRSIEKNRKLFYTKALKQKKLREGLLTSNEVNLK